MQSLNIKQRLTYQKILMALTGFTVSSTTACIEKTKSTGGTTTYFYKTEKSYLDKLLELDECNY